MAKAKTAKDMLSNLQTIAADSKLDLWVREGEVLRENLMAQVRLLDERIPAVETVIAMQAGSSSTTAKADERPFGSPAPGAKMSIRVAIKTALKQNGEVMKVASLMPIVAELRGLPTSKHSMWAIITQSDELKSKQGDVGLSTWPSDRWGTGTVAEEDTG